MALADGESVHSVTSATVYSVAVCAIHDLFVWAPPEPL